jgi:hypothetical protein
MAGYGPTTGLLRDLAFALLSPWRASVRRPANETDENPSALLPMTCVRH